MGTRMEAKLDNAIFEAQGKLRMLRWALVGMSSEDWEPDRDDIGYAVARALEIENVLKMAFEDEEDDGPDEPASEVDSRAVC